MLPLHIVQEKRGGSRALGKALIVGLLMTVGVGSSLQSAEVLPNPTFADTDGDGVPDGWEVKTLVLEKYKGVHCLSMNFRRHNNAPVEGEVSMIFQGEKGFYTVTITYLDQSDGISKGKFLVNGKPERIWDFDLTFRSIWRDEVIENVELGPGDRISIYGRDQPYEYCRIRSVQIKPSLNPPTAQELEERRNPPPIEEREYGPLVALKEVRDISALDRHPRFDPKLNASGASILVLKKPGEIVALDIDTAIAREPGDLVYFITSHREFTTGIKPSTPKGSGIELPFDPHELTAAISLPAEEEGLFEISLADRRRSSIHISSDTPHVLYAQSAAAGGARGGASGAFYFFVPKGTQTFGVGAYSSGKGLVEVTVIAPDGTMVTKMDVPKEAEKGLPIRVPEGLDDSVWSLHVKGVNPTIRLVGVPPFLATHPRTLLVPEECILKR